jgi:predicted DNA-binding transcriptional regulator YafY
MPRTPRKPEIPTKICGRKPVTSTAATPTQARVPKAHLPKDVLLLQLAMTLLAGETLTYARLHEEFLLERRTAERYMAHLAESGLPVTTVRVHREARFQLDRHRTRLDIDAVDVPPAAARSLSLLLVAASLLPAHLGVREAVDRTVRAALRLRGMKAARELRRLEDAVLVLENDAKDYTGKDEVFGILVEATLAGHLVHAHYRSPKNAPIDDAFYSATIGLYKGGLYTLAVPQHDDGTQPVWRALERIEGTPHVDSEAAPLSPEVRLRALDEAKKRWGPARPKRGTQVITLHFSKSVTPYVLARPWHSEASVEPWDDGGVRMSLRLSGRTEMFESWVKSWGPEVQVLRPADMAERIASELEDAARRHRESAAAFARSLDDA